MFTLSHKLSTGKQFLVYPKPWILILKELELNKILKNFNCVRIPRIEAKLRNSTILVKSDHGPILWVGHNFWELLHCKNISHLDEVRSPGVRNIYHELLVDTLEQGMPHAFIFHVAVLIT
jgi:hypothetical protein